MRTWIALPLLLLAAAGFAGCASQDGLAPSPGPAAPAATDHPDRLSRGRGSSPGDLVFDGRSAFDAAAASNGTLTAFHGITSLHWATRQPLPGLALELQLDLGKSNECTLKDGALVHPGHETIHEVFLVEGDGWQGWGSGGSAPLASAHAGPVDTRAITGEDGRGGGAGSFQGRLSGPLRLTLVTPRLEAWDNGFLMDEGVTAAVSVTCASPFDLLATRGGTAVALDGPSGWSSGAGADVGLVATANVADSMALSFAGPTVRAAAGGFGDQAALLTLGHPGGQETWTFLPEQDAVNSLEGGPGDYTLQATDAGAVFSVLWAGIWGFDGPFDLRPGLREDTAVKIG